MIALAVIAASVAQPRMRAPRGAVSRPPTRWSDVTMGPSSLLEQETEHQGTDRHEHEVEREEETEPRAGLTRPPGGRERGRPHPGDQHRRRERQHEEGKDRFASARRLGEHAKE